MIIVVRLVMFVSSLLKRIIFVRRSTILNDVAQSSDRCRMPASKTLLVLGKGLLVV